MNQKEIKKLYQYLRNDLSVKEACANLNITREEFFGLAEYMKLEGYDIEIVEIEEELIIKKKRNFKREVHVKDDISDLEKVELCVVSDPHLGAKYQQLTLLNKVYTEAYNRGITTVLNCGDTIDGDYTKIRPDQNYSLFVRGFDEQAEYIINMYPEINGMATYFIEGSHDQTHYKNDGATIGKWVSKLRSDMKFLGVDEYMFKAGNKKNLDILMKHPGGGVAKAYSYKLQEAINKMSSGSKPKILLQGHYHKSYYFFYRNVHAFSLPCLCDKSGFMKRMDLLNVIGAYFITAYINKKGEIQYIIPEEFLFKDSEIVKDDYKRCRKLEIK